MALHNLREGAYHKNGIQIKNKGWCYFTKSLKRNLLYQTLYQILMFISPLITAPYIARTLGNEMYGTYSYYYSIAYYFGMFAMLGMANYGNRIIAQNMREGKEKISEIFSQLISLQLIMFCAVSFFYFVTIPIWGGEYKINAVIEWIYIASVGLDISWFYFGMEEFEITTKRSFFVKIIMIICILLFVKDSNDLNIYTSIMACGVLVGSGALWFKLPCFVAFRKSSLKDIFRHIKPNVVLFIPVISLTIFHYTDKIMLGAMSTWSETGYYTNADKIVNIPMGIINGLGVVMLPRISSLSADGEEEQIKKYVNISILLSVWGGSALCFGIMAVATEFVPVFLGEGYEKCAELLEILSVVVLIKSISNVFRTQYLIPLEKDKEFNLSVISAALINVLLNYICIPKCGAMGAVIGTLISESIVLISYSWFSRRIIMFKAISHLAVGFIFSGIVMLLGVNYIKKLVSGNVECSRLLMLAMEVITGILIYFAFTVLNVAIFKKRNRQKFETGSQF